VKPIVDIKDIDSYSLVTSMTTQLLTKLIDSSDSEVIWTEIDTTVGEEEEVTTDWNCDSGLQ
jgi:hypothetical protein